MSDDNLNDPHARVARNSWYLYYDRSPAWGGGDARAVVEVVHGHKGYDDEPVRTLRRTFIQAPEAAVETHEVSDAWEPTGWITFSDRLTQVLTDEEFEQLIADGTLIPLRTP